MTAGKQQTMGVGVRRLVAALVCVAVALGVWTAASPADAATSPGYPTAQVAFMATTRIAPYLTAFGEDSNSGWALRDPGATSGNQTVAVACWWDGDWATGNYRTNRWFRVLVYENLDGFSVPRWLFVHASYVYNQPVVPQCRSTPVGIFSPDPSITLSSSGAASLHFFPLGNAAYFCHSGGGFPTGGTITRSGNVTVTSAFQSLGTLCPATGDTWLGIAASDYRDYYSNVASFGGGGGGGGSPPGILGGFTNEVLDGDFTVGSPVTVSGGAKNYGGSPLAVQQIEFTMIDPDGRYHVSVCTDPGLGALTGISLQPGQTVQCNATVVPDQEGYWTYSIDYVDGAGGFHHGELYNPSQVHVATPVTGPPNDDFANAEDVTTSGVISGDLSDATAEAGEPGHVAGFPAQYSLWYRFTAHSTGRAWISMSDDDQAVGLAAYTGDQLGALTRLAEWQGTNDDQIALPVVAGDVYYVAVDAYGDNPAGQFFGSTWISPLDRPGNDDFAAATPLASGGDYFVDLTDATTEPGEPAVDPRDGNVGSAWFSYTPAQNVTLTLLAKPDTGLDGADVGIFSGASVSSLSRVYANFLSPCCGPSALVYPLTAGRTYYVAVDNIYPGDTVAGVPEDVQVDFTATMTPVATSPAAFTTVPPRVVLDTASHLAADAPLAAGAALTLDVAAATGVARGQIAAVAVAVTASDASGTGGVVAYGATDPQPATSTVTYVPGRPTTATAIVHTGTGRITVRNRGAGAVDLDVQVIGVYRVMGVGYHPLGPTRIADTASGLGVGAGGPIAPHTKVRVALAGVAGIPTTKVAAVVLQVTVSQPGGAGSVVAYPDDQPRPPMATVSFTRGATASNLAVVDFANGYVDLYNASNAPVQVAVDVQGYHAGGLGRPAGTINGTYVQRLLDTTKATATRAAGPVPAHGTVTFSVSPTGTPAARDIVSATVNVTVRGRGGSGPVIVYPAASTRPSVAATQIVAGAATTGLTVVGVRNGRITVYNGSSRPADLAVDLVAFTMAS